MSAIAHSVQMDNICRTCLSEEQNMKSVFDNDFSSGETLQLFQMLMACTSVQVAEDDGLPPQICLSCINCIARSFAFKRLCEHSDSTLRKLLEKSTIIHAAELKPSADVRFCTQATLDAGMDTNSSDMKMEFEEGETNINDPIFGSEWTDCERDDINVMKNFDDSKPQTIACANNNPETNCNIEENPPMPDQSDQTIYPCDECTASFTVENDLKIHSHTHQKSPKRQCTVNTPELATSNQLQSDRNLPGDVNVKHTCTQCGKSFQHPSKLKRHLATHTGVKAFACNVCDKRFAQSCHRTEHMRAHSDDRNYTCAECGMSFLRWRNLISHQRRYVGIAVHTCSVTGKQTCDVTRHMHKEVKDHVCSYCGKGFGTAATLKVHERRHTGENRDDIKMMKNVDDSKPQTIACANNNPETDSNIEENPMPDDESDQTSYPCDECTASFTVENDLKIHSHTHQKSPKRQCTVNRQELATSNQLQSHPNLPGDVKHTCTQCGKSFQHPSKLKRHLATHSGVKAFACNVCDKRFAQSCHRTEHMRAHSDDRNYTCAECGMSFVRRRYLNSHQRRHADIENDLKIHSYTHRQLPKRKCTVNTPELATSNQLQSDLTLPGDVNVKHTCTQCGKSFQHPSKLKRHLATHTGVKPFACNVCDKRFTQSNHRNDHMRGHSDERNYTCAECGMSFLRRRNLIWHQRRTCEVTRHMHKKVKDHVCSYCGKGFGMAATLKVHERRHTGEKPFTCTVCNKGFCDRSGWIVHARAHSGERPYVCDVCDKGCVSSSQLKTHKKMHTGEKPHRCHFCAKAFTRSEHLRMHIKRHTGEQDHICVYCKKGFHSGSELKVHLRVHTGEKPYSCKICHKSFAQISSLSFHLKRTSH